MAKLFAAYNDRGNVTIGDYVKIGSNVSVILNHRGKSYLKIGNNVIWGAGAVVVKDVSNDYMVEGVPSRVLKDITQDDNWLTFRICIKFACKYPPLLFLK